MDKLILTVFLLAANLAHAGHQKREQIECLLPDSGEVEAILIESGTGKQDPGTLTLLGGEGTLEKVAPIPGVGGIFEEYRFPVFFRYENDALNPQRLKFDTTQLGPIYLAYICNRPNAYPCEDRSGNLVDSARVALNIDGKRLLKFNGHSLPLCKRRVVE